MKVLSTTKLPVKSLAEAYDPWSNNGGLRTIISPRDWLPHAEDGDRKKVVSLRYLTGSLVSPQKVNARTVDKPPEDDVLVPQAIVNKMLAFLMQEEHISRGALAMIFWLSYLRELYSPPLSRVRPG